MSYIKNNKNIQIEKKKKLKGAEAFGVKVTIDHSLDKYQGKMLFPEQLKLANEILSKIKNLYS